MNKLILIIFSLLLFSCNEEQGVVSELKECDSSKEANCQNTGNLENDVIIRVEGEEDQASGNRAAATNQQCEKGYIQIDNFCVMKDEATQANRYKIRTKSIDEAQKVCLERGKTLITHKQWMSIAQKIEAQSLNYDLGKEKKFLNSRDLFISKSTTITNFVSAQPEWVAWDDKSLFLPSECHSLSGDAYKARCQKLTLGSSQLPGSVFNSTLSQNHNGSIAMVRSGSLAKHKKALYHAYLGTSPAINQYGVRCTYSL